MALPVGIFVFWLAKSGEEIQGAGQKWIIGKMKGRPTDIKEAILPRTGLKQAHTQPDK